MNSLARELNQILDGTAAYRLLSDYGKRIYFPKGIVAQAVEAGKSASRHNASAGMAYENGKPMILPAVADSTKGFSSFESVAYAPVGGDEELRRLWREEMKRKNPGLKDGGFSLPLVVPGLTTGIALAADLFVDAGDTVVLPDLYWDNYELIFKDRLQADLKVFPFFAADGSFNTAGLKEVLSKTSGKGKIVLLLNFPNNPAGYTPTIPETDALARTVRDCADEGIDIVVISDDAYYGLFFEDGIRKESGFSLFASLHDRVLAVKVDGSTKEDFVWGFRVAFLSYGGKGLQGDHYSALITKSLGAIRATVSSSSRLAQSIMVRVMKDPGYHRDKEEKFAILRKRYEKVREILRSPRGTSPLRPLPFNSGYFMSFLCEGISAEALRRRLLSRGIGTISLQDRLLRVAYASIDISGMEELYGEIFQAAEDLLNEKS